MSEEMAVGDKASEDIEVKVNGDGAAAAASAASIEEPSLEPPSEPGGQAEPETKPAVTDAPEDTPEEKPLDAEPEIQKNVDQRAVKRKASAAFSDEGNIKGVEEDQFKGFEVVTEENLSNYSRVLENLEAEIKVASKTLTPVTTVMASPAPHIRPSKRPRQNTDGSRPSSALSSRSEGDGALSTEGASVTSSPAARRTTTEMSSPLLRVPMERGWKRELVYRAALDSHSRRNADIYYYTPKGKKLRSTREVAENLSGSGLTVENFSFFKEPLGLNDPEREIIRDAKPMRRVESPVQAPATAEGKRTPKPKPPKGASPDHGTPKSPPLKLKVKSVGSRLSSSGPSPAQKHKKPADNNNSAGWKKPRLTAAGNIAVAGGGASVAGGGASVAASTDGVEPPSPPPPLQSRPITAQSEINSPVQSQQQPCSLQCGRGVPSLACAACLCLYHPACAGLTVIPPGDEFYCRNCRKSTSPPLEPPPLIHKSGVPLTASAVPTPRRIAGPPPRQDKRVLLRMKVAGGGPGGERVWAVTKPAPAPPKTIPPPPKPVPTPKPIPPPTKGIPTPLPVPPAAKTTPLPKTTPPPRPVAKPRALAPRGSMPQSIAIMNGRRFIVVPRSVVHNAPHDEKRTRARVANGAAPDALSPRRRRRDDTDYFTPFYNAAKKQDYNVVVQIFQYLGMRELGACARVCRTWRALAATPQLWRHVRMKNSHVGDWEGLCSALKRHGTKRLDLRKMLLPQNDAHFWEQFAKHIADVDTLERIEMCRCPAPAVEAVCRGLPNLRSLSALAIRDALLDPGPLGALPLLHELRLKSMCGLSLTRDLKPIATLKHLQHLSLTSIKDLGWSMSDVVGKLENLESLELGECTFRAEFAARLGCLRKLRRLRLERGTAQCAAPALLTAIAALPLLTRLELVNIDIKVGFDDALADCKNIQRLLIIPTYVSQSATTNKQVLSGVLRLKDTLTHLMWGVTNELLRVTELFIDQCEGRVGAARAPRDVGECIPVLKPVPGYSLPATTAPGNGPPQVEILPLPTLQRLLSAQLPNTKLKLLRIPFHATWRQSLADFQ